VRTRFRQQEFAETSDGRNVDSSLGRLEGEGAQQQVLRADQAFPTQREALLPSAEDTRTSYYGRPAIKEPVWIWSVPVYFYVGGLGGAAGVLAAAAQLSRDAKLRPLVRRLRWISAGSAAVGSGLLVHDLGRPSRFLNMLRVFRPSSPMSMGSWLLAGVGTTSALAALLGGARAPALRSAGDAAGLAAAALDLPFAAYTSVLLANTAVPIWQASRRSLPLLFMASSAASLTSLLELMELTPRERGILRRYGNGARAAEFLAAHAVEHDASLIPEVGRPLREGASGACWTAGKWMNAASLALSLLPRDWRWARKSAGVLGTAAAFATRFAVFTAGRVSARNPHATFEQQRAPLTARPPPVQIR
jgi:formate-dependent nitrite reductase membrane component NrfD